MRRTWMSSTALLVAIASWGGCGGKKASTAGGTGGAVGSGGSASAGGAVGSGGAVSSGGTVGSGGAMGSGGAVGSGGMVSSGGVLGSGGAVGSGGSLGSGGAVGTGGGTGSGGVAGTGGVLGRGGVVGTGGTSGSGGKIGSGGAVGSGGSTTSGGVVGGGGSVGTGGAGGTTATWWKPAAGTTWQWQIGGGTIDPTLAVQVFDLDWEQDASVVASLHGTGKKVICYVSVGSWEDWRSDAATFPAAVIGNDYPGWPGEKFVDIRADALRTIMAKRFDVCQQKGFDALEPDNMDVFEATSGFPLTRADGVSYALWLAGQSHQRGMAIVQKNASSIVTDIRASYDGALTEDCYADGWCADMQPYIDANQPVFACEYTTGIFSAACTWGQPRKYSFILKTQNLDATVQFCP